MTARDLLRPGDCLLYTPTGFFGYAISIKTWHRISHCELYVGRGWSAASRDGVGVNLYPLRMEQLAHILRPTQPFDVDQALTWFDTVRGQKYDWWGLLRFFTWTDEQPHDRMFCSECVTRIYRHGGFEPFQPDEDADGIAPFQFLTATPFRHWVVNGGLATNAHFTEGDRE